MILNRILGEDWHHQLQEVNDPKREIRISMYFKDPSQKSHNLFQSSLQNKDKDQKVVLLIPILL